MSDKHEYAQHPVVREMLVKMRCDFSKFIEVMKICGRAKIKAPYSLAVFESFKP